MKISKTRLKEIIKEEYERSTPPGDGFGDEDDGYYPERPGPPAPAKELEGNTFEMSADDLINLGQTALRKIDKDMLEFQSAVARLVEQHDGGEFVNLKTHANMAQNKLDEVKEGWTIALGSFEGRR